MTTEPKLTADQRRRIELPKAKHELARAEIFINWRERNLIHWETRRFGGTGSYASAVFGKDASYVAIRFCSSNGQGATVRLYDLDEIQPFLEQQQRVYDFEDSEAGALIAVLREALERAYKIINDRSRS